MMQTDKRIDKYILDAAEFARPVLIHLRDLVHVACPDVKETMKWSFPHFEYDGNILCSMAAFTKHCAFGFWNAAAIDDDSNILQKGKRTAMGHMGKITSLKSLPEDGLITEYIIKAMVLIETGVTAKKPPQIKKNHATELMHEDFQNALDAEPIAKSFFSSFSPSKRREYTEWVCEAKTESTRIKRIANAIEWIKEGKPRHWKYERK